MRGTEGASNPSSIWSSCGTSDLPTWGWGGPDSEGMNDVCYPSVLPFWKFSTIFSASGSREAEGLAQSGVTVMIVKSAFAMVARADEYRDLSRLLKEKNHIKKSFIWTS